MFNKAIDMILQTVDKYIVLIDVKNGNFIDNYDGVIGFLKKIFYIFEKFYVERLPEIYIINKKKISVIIGKILYR
jgi:hypothetical protein